MPNPSKIFKSLSKNYNLYLKNPSRLDLLEDNIALYKGINNLNGILRHAPVDKLTIWNDCLGLVAKNYIECFKANRDASRFDKALENLSNALRCHQTISNTVSSVSPPSLTKNLGEQQTESVFFICKIKFLQAETRLLSIENKIASNQHPAPEVKEKLTEIIKAYTRFQQQLKKGYKDEIYKSAFSITEEFELSISNGLKRAEELLVQISDDNSQIREDEETEEIEIKQKKRKRAVIAKEEELEAEKNDTLISTTSSSSLQATPPVIVQSMESEKEEIAQLLMGLSHPTPGTSPFGFFMPSPPPITSSHVNESNECLLLINKWENAYFKDAKTHNKEKILEKLGHILLLAANELHMESLQFKMKPSNPALLLAISIFSASAQLSLYPSSQLIDLSVRYHQLFQPFINDECISKKDYLWLLHKEFSEQKALVNFKQLPLEAIVDKLFETLIKECQSDDYHRIAKTCFDSLHKATNKLNNSEEGFRMMLH